MNGSRISMIHGSGGAATRDLIEDVFAAAFDNGILSGMEDAAVIGMEDEAASGMELAVTTDSFVVTPVEFCGGDIGREGRHLSISHQHGYSRWVSTRSF